ncbi:MAG: type II toxin-antitoxin system HicA family toxin [Nitrospinae bacterium]|nr:type II toxin-antitoxin system HicA family toxin [Nitrospinota bacterium]
MAPSIPLLRPGEVVKAFQRLGWTVSRKRGIHIIMTKQGHIATLSIPDHRETARGTLRGLISSAGITVDDFLENLKKR